MQLQNCYKITGKDSCKIILKIDWIYNGYKEITLQLLQMISDFSVSDKNSYYSMAFRDPKN